MQSMHTYRAWTNKEGHALGRTQHISIASLNAMIQNLAEQTPPCGKHIPTVIV